MRDEKTRSFVIDGKSNFVNNLTTRQLKTIQSDRQINEHKTIRQQFNDIKNGAQDTRKISQINPFVSYFPRFYTKEIRNAFILFIL
jgi:hypothetical protein